MEELRRLSAEYYKNIVRFSYYGVPGFLYILLSLPFLFFSAFIHFKTDFQSLSSLPMLIAGFFWLLAKRRYDKNLITHLAKFTHLDSSNISEQKALYLQNITSHISSSLFDTMQIFKEIIETNKKYRSFVIDNLGYYFSRFIYDPDSKNRILSLTIYLISLIALLTVIKPNNDFDIYALLNGLSKSIVITYFSVCMFLILISYFVVIAPLMFLFTFVIIPILLKMSNMTMLSKYFMSELNKYSLLEIKIS